MKKLPPIRPVTNDAEHAAVLAVLDKVMDANAECLPGTPAAAYIRAQAAVIAEYESTRWPIPEEWGGWDAVDYIRHVLRDRRLTQREIAPCFGSQPRCSAVLNRRRRLTLPMIRRLHARLGIPAEVLLR